MPCALSSWAPSTCFTPTKRHGDGVSIERELSGVFYCTFCCWRCNFRSTWHHPFPWSRWRTQTPLPAARAIRSAVHKAPCDTTMYISSFTIFYHPTFAACWAMQCFPRYGDVGVHSKRAYQIWRFPIQRDGQRQGENLLRLRLKVSTARENNH